MNLIDPRTVHSQARLKDLAVKAMKALEGQDDIDGIHALCLALAQASSRAGVENFEVVVEELRGMYRSIEAARPSVSPANVRVVSPEVFARIQKKYGIKTE